VQETTHYYDQMSSVVSPALQRQWEADIISAESKRYTNPSVMDILGVQQMKMSSEPEPIEIGRAGANLDWLDLALSIEERQYVKFRCISFLISSSLCRVDVQDKVRRLEKEPREEARAEVERLRQHLTAEFLLLHTLSTTIGEGNSANTVMEDADPTAFDNLDNELDNEPEPDTRARARGRKDSNHPELIPPERRPVVLPSTHLFDGHPARKLELDLRIKQATQYLAAVQEAVAEKSFQYSHVMRKASSKAVRTRSRAVIAKLNDRIAVCCKVYARARSALVRLRADDRTLATFGILVKDDVKASTAILDPNTFGSSSIKLSWIWQARAGSVESGPEMMRECEFCQLHSIQSSHIFSPTCPLVEGKSSK